MKKIISILDRYLIVRYLISGGLSAAIDILIFALMIQVFNFHYIFSAVVSVTVSFFARFYLQKMFAFKDRGLNVHKQIFMYSILYVSSMAMTTFFLYVFIGLLQVWYLPAQVMTIGIIAVMSFFVYRYFIFKQTEAVQSNTAQTETPLKEI